jgi:hypothetical protein
MGAYSMLTRVDVYDGLVVLVQFRNGAAIVIDSCRIEVSQG